MSLSTEPVLALLALRGAIDAELRRRGAVRSSRLGEWYETLVARATGGTLTPQGTPGHAVVSPEGLRYEVKAQRRRPYVDIKSFDFDVLVVVIFGEDARVQKATAVPVQAVRAGARPCKKRDARGEPMMWLPAPAVVGEDWTSRLREAEGA